jgi:hypothetical protein
MRKLWIVGMIVGAMSFAGCGGSDNYYVNTSSASTNGIPNSVLSEFYKMYPAAQDVDWEVKGGLYNADFQIEDEDMNASFTPDGKLLKVDG